MEPTAEAITNDAGQVALRIWPYDSKLVQETPSGNDYLFAWRANITMAFVDPQDVDNLLNRWCGCNCGDGKPKRKCFGYASEDEVRRWENGGGR